MEVRFHRSVIVEMVAREIREPGRMHGYSVKAPEIECVRRSLQREVCTPGLFQFAHHPEQVERLWSRVHSRQNSARQMIFHGANQPGDGSRSTKNGINQKCTGRLAIGACDGSHSQAFVRAVEKVLGCGCECLPPMRNLQPRYA